MHSSRNNAVRATDYDALSAKCSAVSAGYIQNEQDVGFLSVLVKDTIKLLSKARSPRQRGIAKTITAPKLPLINRGSYLRTIAIDKLVSQFLELSNQGVSTIQIVSLGAGSDTRCFTTLSNHPDVIYHEVDFPQTVEFKSQIINESEILRSVVYETPDSPTSSSEIHTSRYHLHGLDLTTVSHDTPTSTFKGLDTSLPTMVISECCLCYLQPDQANTIISWFITNFPRLALATYDPMGGTDQFGQVMVQNLATRHISIPTLMQYRSLTDQIKRLKELGFEVVRCADINFIESNWISKEEQHRLDRLEIMDEREEWVLLAKHYSIVWCFKGFESGLWTENPIQEEIQ